MQKLYFSRIFLILPACLLFFACSSPADDPDRELLELRCGRCHEPEHPLSRQKSEDGWRRTVWAMRQRGAQMSDEEAARIVQYLTRIRGE